MYSSGDAQVIGYENYYVGDYEETDSTISIHLSHFIEESSSDLNEFIGKKEHDTFDYPYLFTNGNHTFRKINWGERKYLMNEYDYLHFVSDINCLIEPRESSFQRFYILNESRGKSVTGLPALPQKYQALIDTTFMDAEIISIESDTTVMLKFDKVIASFEGMELNGRMFKVKLSEVKDDTITAKVYYKNYYPNNDLLRDILKMIEMTFSDFGVSVGVIVKNR
jgi:hypothetical protein